MATSLVDRRPLFTAEGRATSSDSKSVQLHRFEVPAGVDVLALRFDYQPRRTLDRERNTHLVDAALTRHNARRKVELDAAGLESQRQSIGAEGLSRALNNLMNVVLIDPAGVWRGRWDRNPSSDSGDLVLTRNECSRGFLPGEIQPGRWTAAVECHGVFGEPVTYQLEIAARTSLTDAERQSLAHVESQTPAQLARKQGRGWYFGELHSHTVHSDGKHELAELAQRVHATGADFLCLTDHNTTSGLLQPGSLPVTLIAGCELTTFHGHHPIYGLTDIVPWHEDGRVIPLEELAPSIRRRGGVVSVAHPFKIGDPICTGCRMRDDLSPESFDLMEVWYRAWDAAETDNLTAYALWNSYWAKGHRVTAVAARDWHGPGQESPFPGSAPFTGVLAEENTPQAILAALGQGRAIMSGGPIIDFRLVAPDGTVALVGGELPGTTTADGRLQIDRLEPGVELRVFRNGERVLTLTDVVNGTMTLPGVASSEGWYRIEAWLGDMPRVITNHIVVGDPFPSA